MKNTSKAKKLKQRKNHLPKKHLRNKNMLTYPLLLIRKLLLNMPRMVNQRREKCLNSRKKKM